MQPICGHLQMGCIQETKEKTTMLFNSYIFVLAFLPVTVAGYYLLNRLKSAVPAHLFLLAMSLCFYGYFNLSYLPIILVSVLVNYGMYRAMISAGGLLRKLSLALALAFDLGVLFYYKYFDFFLENVNAVFHSDFPLRHLLLPLGISFFTFQQMSFVIDAYRGEVGSYGMLDYALFVTFFPQLIAGPIVTHDELVPQFQDEGRRRIDWDRFASGLYIFALGMSKKVLIADTFGSAVNWGFANIEALSSAGAAVTMLSYTIQIYFDFSGYCDMALGIGRMMNIDLPLNFDSPYKARTITEFWDRWHMTLTRFFTRYVYIPLGGSRKGSGRTYLNMMVVFLVSGLWHGANWTFILWGALHGAFSVLTRRFRHFFEKIPGPLNWLITFAFVNFAWVLFRADSIADAGRLIGRIFALEAGPVNLEILSAFETVELTAVFSHLLQLKVEKYTYVCMIAFFVAAFLLLRSRNAYARMKDFSPTILRAGITVLLLIWCVLTFPGVSTFLYFNF